MVKGDTYETEYKVEVRVYTVPAVADEAAAVALQMVGGYTLFESVGGWRMPGTTDDFVEGGKVLEVVMNDNPAKIQSFLGRVDRIAADHGEECVMVTQRPVKWELRYDVDGEVRE